ADIGEDVRDGRLDGGILARLVVEQRAQAHAEVGARGIEPGDGEPAHADAASRRSAAAPSWRTSGSIRAGRVLRAARLMISRADTCWMSSTTTRLLARKVEPVLTRSTMASASPTSGASSIDP